MGQDLLFCGTQTNNSFFSFDPNSHISNTLATGQSLIRRIRVDHNLEQVFWSSGGLNKIQKVDANLAGSNRVDVKTNITNVSTINIDAENNKVYYFLGGGFSIFQCDTNGNNNSVLISLPTSSPVLGIEIDSEKNFIYWYQLTPGTRTIKRADLLNGINQITIFSSPDFLFDIKLIKEDSSILFSNRNGNRVQKINTDGTGLTTIVNEPLGPTIGSVAGDFCNNSIYYYLNNAGAGLQIKKTDFQGSTPVIVLDTSFSSLSGIDALYQYNIGRRKDFLGPDVTTCQDSVIMTALVRGGTYLWNNNTTSASLITKQSGIYSVTVTAGNCTKVDSVTVTINTNITVDIGVDSTLCFGDSIVLDATMPSASYLWSDNSTAATLKVKQAGIYWTDVTVNSCTKRDSVTINIDPEIQPTLGNDTSICFGDSIVLNSFVTGAAYLWNDNSSSSTLKVKQSGIYSVTVTAGNCAIVDSITVTVNPYFTVDIGVDSTLCFGDSIVLDATMPSSSYLWSNNSTAVTLKVKQAGIYWAEVTVNGCLKRDSVTINIDPDIQPTLGNDTSICFGDSIVLNSFVTGAAYLWNDNSSSSTLKVKQSGIYSVTVTAGNCAKIDSITVTVNPDFTVDIGVDSVLCFGDSIVLDATMPSASYLWSNNSTAATLKVKQARIYWVDVAVSGCVRRDSATINIHPNIQPTLGNDTSICFGDSVQFNLNFPRFIYLWSDASTDSAFTIKESGVFWAEITSKSGCKSRDSIQVSVNSSSLINLGNDTTLCFGDSLILNVTNAATSIKWSDNSTNSTLTITSAGIYFVDVDLLDCSFRDSIVISFTNNIGNSFLGPNTSLCNGDSINFNFGLIPSQTFLWSDSSTLPTNTFKQSGPYWLEISENSCASRDSFNLIIKEKPQINLGPDTSICKGELFGSSSSNPNTSYLWNTGANDSTIAITTNGIYWLEVFLNGCITRDSINLTTEPKPSVNIGTDTTLCLNDTLRLFKPSFNSSFLWNDSSTIPSFEVTEPGLYWLDVTFEGCSNRDSVMVEYFDTLGTSFLPETVSICPPEQKEVTLPLFNSTYLWQDGSSARNYSLQNSGVYFVEISNTCGTRTDTLIAEENCPCSPIFPTIFTPNNDNINDFLEFNLNCDIDQFLAIFFSRWGEKVFESSQPNFLWDGIVKGKKAKVGTYYYVVKWKLVGGSLETRRGSLLLTR